MGIVMHVAWLNMPLNILASTLEATPAPQYLGKAKTLCTFMQYLPVRTKKNLLYKHTNA